MVGMSDVDPADLARLRSRRTWSEDATGCAAGHAVVFTPDEPPRCERCGAVLSPDALRKAGYKPERR
jgi:hypothetical protein